MNSTFPKTILTLATAAMFFNVSAQATGQEPNLKSKTRTNSKSTTLKVTNHSSATNFYIYTKAIDRFQKAETTGAININLKKGSVVEEVLPHSGRRWDEYYLVIKIRVWDPKKKMWTDDIDATHGGFNIAKSIGNSEINYAIADCKIGGKDSYCAGPVH